MSTQKIGHPAAIASPLQPLGDGVLYGGGLVVGIAALHGIGNELLSDWVSPINALFVASFAVSLVAVNTALGLYRDEGLSTGQAMARALGATAACALIFYLAIKALVPSARSGQAAALPLVLLTLTVATLRPALYALRGAAIGVRRILIVGANAEAAAIQARLGTVRRRGVELVGFYEAGPIDPALAASLRTFPRSANLTSLVSRWRVNEVIVAVREQRGGVLPLRELLDCRSHGVRVRDQTAFYENVCGEFPIDSLKASWLIYGQGFEQGFARAFAKRCLDLAASFVLLVLAAPIMLLTALAIRLESPGEVIYRQKRVGQNGVPFMVLKFRSMRNDAERDGVARWAVQNDPRITRVGRLIRKTRIDELPQLLNVFRGEMSLVGPRPERPDFVAQLKQQVRFYDLRHSVKPGLTGWAQVRYNYAASVEDSQRKLQYDLFYVKNHSLLLDLRILLETVRVVLRGEGAH